MELSAFISPVVTAIIAIVGSYAAFKNANNEKLEELHVQIAELAAKVDSLKGQVEKHNSVIERTYKLESDVNTAFKRIDELKAKDEKLEEKIGERR